MLKHLRRPDLGATLIAALALGVLLAVLFLPRLDAATTTPAAGVADVDMIAIQLAGTENAGKSSVAAFQMPYKACLNGISVRPRQATGTNTIQVREGATSILSGALSVSSGTVAEASISDAEIADEATVHVDTTIGTSIVDTTILFTFTRC